MMSDLENPVLVGRSLSTTYATSYVDDDICNVLLENMSIVFVETRFNQMQLLYDVAYNWNLL